MERQFLEDLLTHRYILKILRKIAIYELRKQHPYGNPIPDDENDISITVVTDDDEDEEGIALVSTIQLKGVGRKLKAAQNAVFPFLTAKL